MKSVLTAILLSVSFFAAAQNTIATQGCGTMTPQSEIEKIYDFVQHNPLAYTANKTAAAMDTIPLAIHIIGKDDGTGYYTLNNLFPMLCQLNQRYVPVGFRYFIKWPIDYINNSSYYNHNFSIGDAMMVNNNVPGAANVYFVNDPAGACGYYSYNGDAVAIGINCAAPSSTTLTHELGHYFSLAHTFYGWENGTPANPEAVRRSGTGTNCSSAGDGFCDTRADYISSRWNCPAPVGKKDQFNDLYVLDSSIYMSYSDDACQSRFSPQEISAMKYYYANNSKRKPAYAVTTIPPYRKVDTARLVYPRDTMYNNFKKVTWRKVAAADYYYVRVSASIAPAFVLQTELTRDTSISINYAIVDGGEYLINVIPVNAHDFCLSVAKPSVFTYLNKYKNVGVETIANANGTMSVYPNPVKSGSSMQIELNALNAGKYQVSLCNIAGQEIARQEFTHNGGNGSQAFRLPACAEGIYILRWKGEGASGAVRVQVGL